MSNIIGIDLGTTNSVMARLDDIGKPVIVHNKEGANITPSAVEIDGETIMVGLEPKKSARFKNNVFLEFKRDMGTSKTYELAGKSFTPTELSSFVLKKITKDAEQKLGQIDELIITTPANFTNEARAATIKAGTLAGMDVKHIINEPTAAALFYVFDKELTPGKYAVYDLGGGTFDLSIVEINGQDIKVLTSLGIASLGGKDFDEKLESLIIDEIKKQTGTNYDFDPADFDPEEIKISLSQRTEALLRINRKNIKITREQFETAISSLVLQAEMCCEIVLKEANLDVDGISGVLLVGGSSRIPYVQKSVRGTFRREPICSVNPDEVVALGAALYSSIKADPSTLNPIQQEVVSGLVVQDVTNHYFGFLAYSDNYTDEDKQNKFMNADTIQIDDEELVLKNIIIIKKNMVIPCKTQHTFITLYDGQTKIEIQVTQSTTPEVDPELVKVVWDGRLSGLPPDRPKGQILEVTYEYDENERMFCEFRDADSGKDVKIDLSINQGSSQENEEEEIERFLIE